MKTQARQDPPVRPRRWRPPLGPTIGLLLAGMLLITTTMVIGFSTYAVRQNTLSISNALMHEVTWRTRERVIQFMEAPPVALELGLHQAEARGGVLDHPKVIEEWFFNYLKAYSSVSAVFVGDEQGEFLMFKRMPDRSLHTKRVVREDDQVWAVWQRRKPDASLDQIYETEKDPDDRYDPRQRPWYKGAMAANELFWTDVYVFASDKQPGISAAVPILEGKEKVGVLALDISMRDFSSFLASLAIGENGQALLIDQKGRIVAGPGTPVEDETGEMILPLVAQSKVREIAILGQQPDVQASLTNHIEHSLRFDVDGNIWIGVLTPIHIHTNTVWSVVVVAPEDDFVGEIKRANRQGILITAGFVLISLLISAVLTRWIVRSLQSLVREAARVQELQLEQTHDAVAPFREVFDVLDAFEGMKTGLRSFQKYMPVALVRKLLREKTDIQLGSELKEITLLFSDIVGFTSISEQLDPDEMAIHLGHYHAELTHSIQDHSGLVAQYIGDAIFAFWGAPDPVPNHSVLACEAALEMQKLIPGLWKDDPDMPLFHTRIGIHTDKVAVGHFGSPDRLFYTALGDGVNLAARLEGTNKKYGTLIIISEMVRHQTGEVFETRHLDRVRVVGKEKPVEIYELLGRRGEVTEERLVATRAYEEGLQLYFDQQWDRAIQCFERSMTHRFPDLAAEMLVNRCRRFSGEPPKSGWNGVFSLKTK